MQTDDRANIEVNYKWLGLESDEGINTFIPKRKQLEMEELCRQVKPTNYDEVVKRFRAALDTSITFNNRETVPDRFTSILREVILRQQVDEEERNRYQYQARPGLMARLWQRLYRSNRVGVVSDDDVEGGMGRGTDDEEIELKEGNRPSTHGNNIITSIENMEISSSLETGGRPGKPLVVRNSAMTYQVENERSVVEDQDTISRKQNDQKMITCKTGIQTEDLAD